VSKQAGFFFFFFLPAEPPAPPAAEAEVGDGEWDRASDDGEMAGDATYSAGGGWDSMREEEDGTGGGEGETGGWGS
jgi:hypothetical protein